MADKVNQIVFKHIPVETGIAGLFTGAAIEIDGKNLLDWVRQAELGQGVDDIAGDYAWIEARRLFRELGIADGAPSNYSASLMTCPCGVDACWDLRVDILIDHAQGLVIWERVYNADDVDYSAIPRLVFSLKEYREKLAELSRYTSA